MVSIFLTITGECWTFLKCSKVLNALLKCFTIRSIKPIGLFELRRLYPHAITIVFLFIYLGFSAVIHNSEGGSGLSCVFQH